MSPQVISESILKDSIDWLSLYTQLSECEISISGSSSASSDEEAQSDVEKSLEENDIDEETMSLENDVEHSRSLESSTLEECLVESGAQGGVRASSDGAGSEVALASLEGHRGEEILQTLVALL